MIKERPRSEHACTRARHQLRLVLRGIPHSMSGWPNSLLFTLNQTPCNHTPTEKQVIETRGIGSSAFLIFKLLQKIHKQVGFNIVLNV